MQKHIMVDFDGVIHSYKTPYLDVSIIPDPPVPGAIEWLKTLIENYRVTIFSSRCILPEAEMAMDNWLTKNGLPCCYLEQLAFSAIKHGAWIYIDDRGYRFDGTFPTVEQINELIPWHKNVQ